MIHLIIDVVGGVALLGLGVYAGAQNSVTVEKAIATLKQAEANAQTTLSKIVAHKAAPTIGVSSAGQPSMTPTIPDANKVS